MTTTDTSGEAYYPPLIEARRAIALADSPVAKLAALRAGAAQMAIPIRHGFVDQADVADALVEQCSNCGLLDDVGEDVVLRTIGRGFEEGWRLRPREEGDQGAEQARKANGRANAESEADQPADARPPAFSDEALALRFAERHTDDLRYVAAWSRWLSWDGARWKPEETLLALDNARKICREAAAHCNKSSTSSNIASAKTVAAVERLSKADRRLAATINQWDADPWLLNTPAGVVDLRTGRMRPHRIDDYMTKIAAVDPGGECPQWHAFLDRITDDNAELQHYLQRVLGYALTGSTREHALFFGYGTGANGKGVLLNTVGGILGDYHRTAPIETFTASSVDRHPTDLAGLLGARLVTATETEDGRRWAESRIKTLTGGDTVSARFMRQDFFDYTPQFKLFITGNHKPGLRSVDEAIRRRFNLIPFTVTIPPAERDLRLAEWLKKEWPGILAWMIEGCLAWQRHGLSPPETVRAATDAYLEAQDATSAWIEECCQADPNAWERSQTLFASWTAWAERSGEFRGDTKRFRDRLEARGIEPRREPGTGRTGYQGLRIKPPEHANQPYWAR